MSKKAFFTLIFIILAAFGALYWFVFRDMTPDTDSGEDVSDQNIFPFGQQPVTSPNGQTQQGTSTQSTPTIDLTGVDPDRLPRLRQLSLVPAAGVIAFDRASTTVTRHIERATGHIFETSSNGASATKISTITIPKVYEALWATDGQRLLIRYLRDDSDIVRTFYAKVATTTRPEQALEGMFLQEDIRDIVVAGAKAFYMEYTGSGARGIVSNLDGSAKVAVFSSSHSDWGVAPSASAARATIYSRPGALSDGAAYSLNLTNGEYVKIASEVSGLAALASPDGSRAIASGLAGTTLRTVAYDLKTGLPTTLSVTTLVDKCVWSNREKNVVFCAAPQTIPNGSYPDDWYKGKVSFNDSLWRIDVSTGETENVMTPELETAMSMDMTKLSLDQDEDTLVFINKNDMTAWSYRLKE